MGQARQVPSLQPAAVMVDSSRVSAVAKEVELKSSKVKSRRIEDEWSSGGATADVESPKGCGGKERPQSVS